MLAQGSGLFRVDPKTRTEEEKSTLDAHPWRARLESLLKQALHYGADWVYFRLECEAGGPKPEIFIFDQTQTLSGSRERLEIGRLQLELWNYGKVPLAFILRPTAVDVLNLLEPPTISESGPAEPRPIETLLLTPARTLALAGAASKGISLSNEKRWERFSASHFDNGSFWEAPENRCLGKAEQGSMAAMVEEMRSVRKKLEEGFVRHSELPATLAPFAKAFVRRLLILTLMVRFMEEREILPPDYFAPGPDQNLSGFRSLLRHPRKLVRALDQLSKDFNGDLFNISDRSSDVPMRAILNALEEDHAGLLLIADFADGRMKGDQKFFWERYSFRHLPVEAISYVYEDFLEGKSQSYYTPHYLVDLLLDEAMPPKALRRAFNKRALKVGSEPAFPVLDPSCGSGVFLVGAWHRMVEALHLCEKSPSPELLKRVMEQNIHGVDIEGDSVELTIFSLCVALCSSFPKRVGEPAYTFHKLRELKFPTLKSGPGPRRNIDRGDFFLRRRALLTQNLRFQVIIGNPPFTMALTPAGRALDEAPVDEAGRRWSPVPDDKISYLFLRAVPPLLRQGGRACLIQNSGIIYNDKPEQFRRALFENWHVPAILDFTSISGLFKTRAPSSNQGVDRERRVGVKTVAVLIDAMVPDASAPVLHVTFRRTSAFEEREIFEVDPQDVHWIKRYDAANEPRVWKANLLGGGRLLETYRAATGHRTIGDYLKTLRKQNGWVVSEGIISADVESYGSEAEGSKKRYEPKHRPDYAPLPMLDAEGLQVDGIDQSRIDECGEEWFMWPRDRRLFDPPHILVRENEQLPFALRESGGTLLFKDQIVGIKAPPHDLAALKELAQVFEEHQKSFPFFASFGSRYLTKRHTAVSQRDILNLPHPEDGGELFKGLARYLRDDVIDFMIPLVKDNQGAYEGLARDASRKEVRDFTRVFLQVMKSAFPDLRADMEPVDLGRAWCISLHRGIGGSQKFGDPDLLRKHLDSLLTKQMGRSLRCWRIVRHFQGKSLFVLKPKPRRYWLKSSAIRDADDVFSWWTTKAKSPQS